MLAARFEARRASAVAAFENFKYLERSDRTNASVPSFEAWRINSEGSYAEGRLTNEAAFLARRKKEPI